MGVRIPEPVFSSMRLLTLLVSLTLLGVASPVATDSVGGEPSLLLVVYGVDGQSRYWAGALLRTLRAIERCFGSVSRTVHCG